MSAGQREPVIVSFTHISEDVIIPSDKLKPLKNFKSFYAICYALFGLAWFFIFGMHELQSTESIIALPISLLLGYLFAKSTLNSRWIEIDRKHQVINSWTNSKKKKQLPPIKIEDADIFYKKVGRGNAYATSVFKIFVKASVDGKTIEHALHHFPDKTDGGIVNSLTSEVSCFIHDFLNGKPVKPVENNYVFVRYP